MADPTRAETSEAPAAVVKDTRNEMVDALEKETKFKKTLEEVIENEICICITSSYPIMTINMNGEKGKGFEDKRRVLINSIIKSFPVSLIFCQELPGKFETEVVEKCGYGHYEYASTGNEAAVVWYSGAFTGAWRCVKSTNSSIERIVNWLRKSRSDVDVSEASTRSAMVKLTSVGTGTSFLAVSWHGPWSGKEKTDKAFHGLICFLREVCKKESLSSFVIGGDFNFNTSEVSEDDQANYKED